MGTACDTWATGLGSSRGSPGNNGSFCPAHKFSRKERIPGPASPACTMPAARGPTVRACHGIQAASVPFTACFLPGVQKWEAGAGMPDIVQGLGVRAGAQPEPGTLILSPRETKGSEALNEKTSWRASVPAPLNTCPPPLLPSTPIPPHSANYNGYKNSSRARESWVQILTLPLRMANYFTPLSLSFPIFEKDMIMPTL